MTTKTMNPQAIVTRELGSRRHTAIRTELLRTLSTDRTTAYAQVRDLQGDTALDMLDWEMTEPGARIDDPEYRKLARRADALETVASIMAIEYDN